MKYLVLYRSPKSAREQMANATPEQAKAGMDAWMKWANANGKAIVDLGNPVGDRIEIGQGSGGAAGSIGGFSILQADSADALKKSLKDHPHLMMPGGVIEAYEFLPMPGM